MGEYLQSVMGLLQCMKVDAQGKQYFSPRIAIRKSDRLRVVEGPTNCKLSHLDPPCNKMKAMNIKISRSEINITNERSCPNPQSSDGNGRCWHSQKPIP
jgi:hypothetical protein